MSTELLRKAAGLFTNTASSTAHMAFGLSLLEALVYRGIKSKGPGPGDTTGILVDDIEVRVGAACDHLTLTKLHKHYRLHFVTHSVSLRTILAQIFPLLFDLSLMSPIPMGSVPRPDLPMPRLAVKSLYWRVSTLCFTLGCARPECLGVYLWTTYPPVKSLMLMAISSRFYSPVEALLEECVGTKETDAALFLRVKSTALNVKKFAVDCILKHRSNNGVELFITADSVQVRWGRVHEIEDALGTLERDLAEYLFSDVPAARPVESVATLSSIVNSGTRKRTRVAADDDIEYIRDEREKQGQRREQERGARAERAAARLHRDAISSHERASVVPGTLSKDRIDSTAMSSKVITLTLPHVLHSRTAGKASDCGTSNPSLEILGQATEDAAMGLAILSSSMPLPSSAAETPGRSAAEEYRMPLLKIPALLSSDGPPYSTTRGELGVEELMVLRCEGMPRIPPDSIIKTVKILSTKFGFGAKLRSCTDPDFIARAITADPTRGDGDTETDPTVETADSADIDADNTARSSAVTLRVSRSAVEASSSWLVPTILEDADAILKR